MFTKTIPPIGAQSTRRKSRRVSHYRPIMRAGTPIDKVREAAYAYRDLDPDHPILIELEDTLLDVATIRFQHDGMTSLYNVEGSKPYIKNPDLLEQFLRTVGTPAANPNIQPAHLGDLFCLHRFLPPTNSSNAMPIKPVPMVASAEQAHHNLITSNNGAGAAATALLIEMNCWAGRDVMYLAGGATSRALLDIEGHPPGDYDFFAVDISVEEWGRLIAANYDKIINAFQGTYKTVMARISDRSLSFVYTNLVNPAAHPGSITFSFILRLYPHRAFIPASFDLDCVCSISNGIIIETTAREDIARNTGLCFGIPNQVCERRVKAKQLLGFETVMPCFTTDLANTFSYACSSGSTLFTRSYIHPYLAPALLKSFIMPILRNNSMLRHHEWISFTNTSSDIATLANETCRKLVQHLSKPVRLVPARNLKRRRSDAFPDDHVVPAGRGHFQDDEEDGDAMMVDVDA